jgi:hypothetical protein
MPTVRIVVDDAYLSRIDELVGRLSAMGLSIRNVGRTLGFIEGDAEVDPTVFQTVEGVKMVTPERIFSAIETTAPNTKTSDFPDPSQLLRPVEGT